MKKIVHALIIVFFCSQIASLEATRASCTCNNGRQKKVADIELGDDIRPICERACQNDGGVRRAQKR